MIYNKLQMPYTLKNKAPTPKAVVRNIVCERAGELTGIEVKNKSSAIIERLTNSDVFNYADKIFAYFSVSEKIVDTESLINIAQNQGKSVFLPKRTDAMPKRFQFTGYNELIRNDLDFLEPRMGIEEDLIDIDLIIVPCVAVSLLGEGIGFERMNYNLLLRNSFAPKVVLAFEFQVFNRIEYERPDIRIDRIITERRIINTREI